MAEQIPHEKRWTFIILIGCLSMFMAEVFAGSSQMWFIDGWSLLVTYWLYLAHLLLFLNLAFRTKRTSIPQLYLWGILFALYESWITKVLWSGYPGSEGPAIALVGGIAILEFFTLVFFWHPVLAFIMPILVFESFALSQNSQLKLEQKILVSHFNYLKKDNKKFFYFCLFLILIGSVFLSLNTGFNIIVALIASIGSIGLIFLFFKLSGRNKNCFSIYSLRLGKLGLGVVFSYIIILYIITFIFLMPQNIPTSFIPFLIIIGFYAFIGIMLRISKPIDESIEVYNEEKEFYSATFFFKIFCLMIVFIIIFCLIPIIGLIIGLTIFLGMIIIAPLFFVFFLKKALKT
jgi:hypothetical protein